MQGHFRLTIALAPAQPPDGALLDGPVLRYTCQQVPKSWSAEQARTRYLLKEEAEGWARSGLTELLVA